MTYFLQEHRSLPSLQNLCGHSQPPPLVAAAAKERWQNMYIQLLGMGTRIMYIGDKFFFFFLHLQCNKKTLDTGRITESLNLEESLADTNAITGSTEVTSTSKFQQNSAMFKNTDLLVMYL